MRTHAVLALIVPALAACAATPPPAPTMPAAEAPVAGPPGSIGVSCKAIAAGHPDYAATTVATKLDVCSVGGDGALTLVVKGDGADRVNLYLAGYHGAGSYPLTAGSTLDLSNSLASAGKSQTTKNCAAARCTAEVTDGATGAAPNTPRELDFAVTCTQLCDADTHLCTTSPSAGGSITWAFRAEGCAVR